MTLVLDPTKPRRVGFGCGRPRMCTIKNLGVKGRVGSSVLCVKAFLCKYQTFFREGSGVKRKFESLLHFFSLKSIKTLQIFPMEG